MKTKVGSADGSVFWGLGKANGALVDHDLDAEAEVNAFTIDLISISAQMLINGALETVCLEKAIKLNARALGLKK